MNLKVDGGMTNLNVGRQAQIEKQEYYLKTLNIVLLRRKSLNCFKDSKRSLNLVNVSGTFYILIAGLLLSLLITILEIIYKAKKASNDDNQVNIHFQLQFCDALFNKRSNNYFIFEILSLHRLTLWRNLKPMFD